MNQEDQASKWQRIIAKAWMDEGFKKRLLAEPATVLKEGGVDIPPGVKVQMAEDTDKVFNLVLPKKPPEVELSDEELENVAGGGSGAGAGKVTFNPFTITKHIDTATPMLIP